MMVESEESVVMGKKFLVDGITFLRIDGVWFEHTTTNRYVPVDRPDLETIYNEVFA